MIATDPNVNPNMQRSRAEEVRRLRAALERRLDALWDQLRDLDRSKLSEAARAEQRALLHTSVAETTANLKLLDHCLRPTRAAA